ncbi:MAG: PHP domain-containing protein [Spirochaetes bacterium]|nr:PHP domain-containing protein [Spirochaetota bacterium]
MDKLVNEFLASPEERLEVLRSLAATAAALPRVPESNNHIHTIYSFSPYAPAAAALKARRSGLVVAGSVDHDSLAGAAEMREACAILGMGSVTGFEIRVFLHDAEARRRDGARRRGGAATPFASRKINNPDSTGIVYMTVQGVPVQAASKVAAFLKPIREARRGRTEKMAAHANEILADAGLPPFDFVTDVVGRSKYGEGGTITERHLLAAMAESLISGFGKGEALAAGLEAKLGLVLKRKLRDAIADPANPYLLYDLLGLLKAEFLPSFFIQPTRECVDAKEAVDFALSIGAIPAYAYLGDVGESPTGDKKAEKFEDDFLPELFAELKRIGYLAVTYMPPRNTREQLARVRSLCRDFGFMEISGVDINQSRQSFNCPELRLPEFAHLNASTWALVAQEALVSADPAFGLFSSDNPYATLGLEARIDLYSRAGLEIGAGGKPASEAARFLREGKYEK